MLEAIKAPENPFPGLRPFDFHESDLFFGRDGQVEKLIAKLSATRFLAVVGTSGSGKSSLVRAGLLPALLGGMMKSAGSNWRFLVMRPGNDPIGNLARALNEPEIFGSDDPENVTIQTAVAETTLRRGTLGLIEVVRQNAMPKTENLLVVVDQFEELFRFAREAARKTKEESDHYQNDAAAFVKLLLQAKAQEDVNIFVVLTMRSDFLGDCAQFWDLPEAINESQYLTPRLTRDQLREVITGPVSLGGGEITARLVTQLLNDIGDDQDQLPVLQHLLMRVWDECKEKHLDVEIDEGNGPVVRPHKEVHQGAAIDLCCYEAVGGMARALSRHAEEALNGLPDDRSREVAEKLFKCLTEKGDDNREIRRPITLGEICAVTGATAAEAVTVIDVFRQPGRSFLMPPAAVELKSDSLVDISHESLIRGWTRLKEWTDEEAQSARTYKRLADTAALHEAKLEGLLKDPALQVALDWREKNQPNEVWARRYRPGFKTAMTFLDESVEAHKLELRELQRQQKRDTSYKRSRILVAVLVPAIILLAAMFVYAARKNFQANARLELADSKRREAEDLGANAQKRSTAASNEAAMARQKAFEAQTAMSVALDQSEKAQLAMNAALDQREKAKLQMSEAILQRDRALKLKQDAEYESGQARIAKEDAETRTLEAEAAKDLADQAKARAETAREKAEKAETAALALKEECEMQRDLALKQAQQLREQAEQIQSTKEKLTRVVESGSVAARRGEGIDVSHHNGRIDWVNLGKSGVSFAFMKATQGTGMVDQTFLANTKAAQTAGIPSGAYHFFTTADPKAQAEQFLNTVGANTDLRPVLAVETPFGGPGWGDSLEGSMRIWLDLVEKKTGCAPIILTSMSFAKNIKSPEFGRYPLWIVRYSQTDPVAPPPWTKWTLWQYTDHGNTGTGDGLFVGDISRLSGSLDDLRCKSKP